MRLTLREMPGFTQVVYAYFGDDDGYSLFQRELIESPEKGSVMPGCGGLRKIRWSDSRRHKGRRGGLRIIYLYIPEAESIELLDVYDKNEADDLTPSEKKILSALAEKARQEAINSFTRKHR